MTQPPDSNPSDSSAQNPLPIDDVMLGRQLGDYTLVRVLATGGMARIYEAVDRKLGRTVALKVLIAETSGDDDTLTVRFIREANAIAQLDHENIITIYQYGEQDGVYFLAMKLIRGKDMAQELGRLRRAGQRMDIGRGLKILEQVAAALDAAHKTGIIHRDVKPSNILVDAEDRATLTDFGLVLRPSTDQTFGTAFGTPRYISPEQAIASDTVSAQSDIYSLAVVLYEIVTGQTPFNGDTPMEIALHHIHEPPPPPRSINPNIPESVEREILRALDKLPEKRHRSASAFIMAIKRGYGFHIDDTPLVPLLPPSKSRPPEDRDERVAVALALKAARENAREPVARNTTADAPRSTIRDGNHTQPLPATSPPPRPRRFSAPLLAITAMLGIIAAAAVVIVWNSSQQNTGLGETGTAVVGVPADATPTLEASATLIATDTDPSTAFFPLVEVAITSDAAATEIIVMVDATSEPATETLTETPTVTPSPTSTPSPTPSPTPTPTLLTIVLSYNEFAFTITNDSPQPLDTSALTIVGGETWSGAAISRGVLPSASCFRIRAQGRTVERPSACDEVYGELQAQAATTPTFFWRRESSGETFEVRLNDDVIAQCPTVERGGSDECTFTLLAEDGI